MHLSNAVPTSQSRTPHVLKCSVITRGVRAPPGKMHGEETPLLAKYVKILGFANNTIAFDVEFHAEYNKTNCVEISYSTKHYSQKNSTGVGPCPQPKEFPTHCMERGVP